MYKKCSKCKASKVVNRYDYKRKQKYTECLNCGQIERSKNR